MTGSVPDIQHRLQHQYESDSSGQTKLGDIDALKPTQADEGHDRGERICLELLLWTVFLQAEAA